MTPDTLDIDVETDTFQLTADQQAAMDAFQEFLFDPIETVFVLSGFSGCGKSTLVKTLLARLPGFLKAVHLIDDTACDFDPLLTATTNKAAENLSQITGYPVSTIHSTLGLRVSTDFKTNITTLIQKPGADMVENVLLFIDEASIIDKELLGHIFKRVKRSKIVFIGDPAQLTQVKATNTPVFNAGFKGAHLAQVVRQAENNPIVALSTKFRHAVNTGEFFSFKPDGHHIRHVDRIEFKDLIEAEFTRPDWKFKDSKILAWTNKCVVDFNHFVRNLAKGDPDFQEGDYAVCNSFVNTGRTTIKTDQLVQITKIEDDCMVHDVPGNFMLLDYSIRVFQPKRLADKLRAIKLARDANRIGDVAEMEMQWTDLRGAYSCTINKSQGSTFDQVFIDLSDVRRCNSGNQIYRMLYVAVSRARNHVVLTGDLA